jgi:hypothetical protein
MKALSLFTRPALQRRVALALHSPPFVVDTAGSAKDCLQPAQIARYEAVLADADPLNFSDLVTLNKVAARGKS